jgi:hypothetical protein
VCGGGGGGGRKGSCAAHRDANGRDQSKGCSCRLCVHVCVPLAARAQDPAIAQYLHELSQPRQDTLALFQGVGMDRWMSVDVWVLGRFLQAFPPLS